MTPSKASNKLLWHPILYSDWSFITFTKLCCDLPPMLRRTWPAIATADLYRSWNLLVVCNARCLHRLLYRGTATHDTIRVEPQVNVMNHEKWNVILYVNQMEPLELLCAPSLGTPDIRAGRACSWETLSGPFSYYVIPTRLTTARAPKTFGKPLTIPDEFGPSRQSRQRPSDKTIARGHFEPSLR